MATKQRGGDFDYDSVHKRGELYPAMYANEKVESHEVVDGDDGRRRFSVTARITDVGKATEAYEDQVVYHTFFVGTDDDPEATDPATWADRRNYNAMDMVAFLTACKLTTGEGRGANPWDLFEEVDDCEFCDHIGKRTAGPKSASPGEPRQKHGYYKVGDRDPGLIGEASAAAPRKSRANGKDVDDESERPARKGKVDEPEDDDEPPAPRKRRQEEDDEPVRTRRAR